VAEALHALDAISAHGAWVDATKETLRAGLMALDGRMTAAVDAYTDAVRHWRELEVPLDLGLCQLEFATMVGAQHAGARAAAEEAKEIFIRLGSPPMLERLATIFPPPSGEGRVGASQTPR
jgi:hypothetical protein